jgi:protein phosphatase
LADGAGGGEAGEIASRTAVEAVRQVYLGHRDSDPENALRRAIETANEAVAYEGRRYSARVGSDTIIATTIAAAAIAGDALVAANVGDSRIYLRSNGQLVQLSHDHPWILDSTVATALGVQSQVEIAIAPSHPIQPGYVILVCSDGLWGMVPPELIASLLTADSAQVAADALIAAALEAGGHDNITAIVCRLLADQSA